MVLMPIQTLAVFLGMAVETYEEEFADADPS